MTKYGLRHLILFSLKTKTRQLAIQHPHLTGRKVTWRIFYVSEGYMKLGQLKLWPVYQSGAYNYLAVATRARILIFLDRQEPEFWWPGGWHVLVLSRLLFHKRQQHYDDSVIPSDANPDKTALLLEPWRMKGPLVNGTHSLEVLKWQSANDEEPKLCESHQVIKHYIQFTTATKGD